jgi:hypothetical protein
MKLKMVPWLDRFEDVCDAAAILKLITDEARGPIPTKMIKSWDTKDGEPITDDTLKRVNNIYAFSYRKTGMI